MMITRTGAGMRRCAMVVGMLLVGNLANADIHYVGPLQYEMNRTHLGNNNYSVTITDNGGTGGTLYLYTDNHGVDSIVSLSLNANEVVTLNLFDPSSGTLLKNVSDLSYVNSGFVLGSVPVTNDISGSVSAFAVGTLDAGGSISADITAATNISYLYANDDITGNITASAGRILEVRAGRDGTGNVGASGAAIAIECGEFEDNHKSLEYVTGDAIFANIDATNESGGTVGGIEATSGNFEGSLTCWDLSDSGSYSGIDIAGDLVANVTVYGVFDATNGIAIGGDLLRTLYFAGDIESPIVIDGDIGIDGEHVGTITCDGSLLYDGANDVGQIIVGDSSADHMSGNILIGESRVQGATASDQRESAVRDGMMTSGRRPAPPARTRPGTRPIRFAHWPWHPAACGRDW